MLVAVSQYCAGEISLVLRKPSRSGVRGMWQWHSENAPPQVRVSLEIRMNNIDLVHASTSLSAVHCLMITCRVK